MQPDEHGLKIELIEAGANDMDWLELEMETPPQTILDMQRESGDGDSGAECKDGKDFLEIKDALTNITREVQGAEKPKDHKKVSRIPVRQKTKSIDTIRDKNPTQIVAKLDTANKKASMDEKWREIQHFVEEEEFALLEKACIEEESTNQDVKDIAFELRDIYQDLMMVPTAINQESEESSLSPRAPLATAEEEETLSEDLTMEDEEATSLTEKVETILEAPEEFRSDTEYESNKISGLDVSSEEIELSSASDTDRDRGELTPEVTDNERNEDNDMLGTERGNVMQQSSDDLEARNAESHLDVVELSGSDGGGSDVSCELATEVTVQKAADASQIKNVACDQDAEADANAGSEAMNEHSGSKEVISSIAEEAVTEMGAGQGDGERLRAARPCDAHRTLAAAVAAVQASIASGDAVGAPTTRCSRVSAVTVRATPRISQPSTSSSEGLGHETATESLCGLDWQFRDGRLVFTTSDDKSVHSSLTNVNSDSDTKRGDPALFDVLDTCSQRIEHESNANADVDETDNATAEPLRSRDINRRSVDTGSRLKLLETKLKEAAGLRDNKHPSEPKDKPNKPSNKWNVLKSVGDSNSDKEQVVDKLVESSEASVSDIVLDKNDNECKATSDEVDRAQQRRDSDSGDCDACEYSQIEIAELGSAADLDAFLDDRFGGRCEFDVKQIGAFSGFGADSEFYLVYDELEDGYEESSGDDDVNEKQEVGESSSNMRGDNANSVEGEATSRKRHNPDHDNLKSLLKKPGRGKEKKNRVSFNENRNEFFDADYIILIREDCEYDEDDDDGVCTCNQHEMVRLTCCEPGCSCGYDEVQGSAPSSGGGPTPQSPKFAPPLEFVDSVTLSPPEGYKDMDLGEQQLIALQQMARHRQHPPVCRECSGVHESDSNSGSDLEEPQYTEKPQDSISSNEYQQSHNSCDEEKEKTDQSQQTTPTTPPADCTPAQSRYIMETITMTTVTERRLVREVEETASNPGTETAPSPSPSIQSAGGGSPISGILKGGKLWKQTPGEPPAALKGADNMQVSDSSNITSDEEGNTLSRRSVRFHESDSNKRDSCDGEADKGISPEESEKKMDETITQEEDDNQNQKETDNCNNSVSPDATEMMLTFKLGHHVLISNNSLRPNSAVRQLFPCSKPLMGKTEEDGSVHQYLVTAESLKAFEEAKRSKLPNIMDGDDTIRKTIERNTLRRSLIRYEPRSKKQQQKTDNSLVERIKQLTCDVDDPPPEDDIPPRGSPQGEESTKPSETINQLNNRNQDKSFSPSSSSTTSSNSSMSSTYKKITDLFGKREKSSVVSDAQNNAINDSKQSLLQTAPDLGNGGSEFIEPQQCAVSKINATSEARKQFLSTLAPLTACVSGTGAVDEYQYQYQLANNPGERISVASTAGTEYSLEDIDEALKNDTEDSKKVAPDVLVGTPSASESTDELAMFVQQDASRIERIKKRYQPENITEEDDEHDDYGFNRRPSVRGIKPRFGSTTEILQQIQNQLQPPGNPQPTTQQRQPNHVWPYYSETGLDNPKSRVCPQGFNHQQYPFPDDVKSRTVAPQYRPTSLIEENIYQNCPNQRCTQLHYGPNVNHVHTSPVMRIGGGCSELYQTLPTRRNSTRPESPPPMELSRSYHQTMVLIPYNRIEGFQSGNVSPNPLYSSPEQCNYARFTNQKLPAPNVANKRYSEPVYQGTLPGRINHATHMDDPQYQLKLGQKQMIRVPYSTGQPVQVHLMTARSESPLPGQFATARATQTPSATLSTCNYYNPGPPNTRYRPAVGPVTAVPHNGTIWHSENPYGSKINRHSFPAGGPRYPMPDNISLADSDSQHSAQLPNGYRPIETSFPATRDTSAPASPTKNRFIERGVPEGAASVSPQDNTTTAHNNSSTMTSPTSPQNPPAQNTNGKSLYYAMNV